MAANDSLYVVTKHLAAEVLELAGNAARNYDDAPATSIMVTRRMKEA